MIRRGHAQAVAAAERVVGLLHNGCDRIEIAGSIRRGAPDSKDIEIVCVAKAAPDLFGGDGFDLLNETIRLRVRERRLAWRRVKGGVGAPEPDKLDGRRFYQLALIEGVIDRDLADAWPIDLFCVRPPAQWGAIFAIRTGPADYARRLVTTAQRNGLRCVDGRLVSTSPQSEGVEQTTPEERDFIARCGLPYVAPNERR